jgi:hypothetical protein
MTIQQSRDEGVQPPPTDVGARTGEPGHCEPPGFVQHHPPETPPADCEKAPASQRAREANPVTE